MIRLLAYLADIVFVAVVAWIVNRAFRSLFGGSAAARRGAVPRESAVHAGEAARDPVCGTFVSTEVSHQLRREGKTLHFCSQECLEEYRKNLPSA